MDAAYPPPVERGDRVAVIAPSHAAPRGAISRGVERLRSFDLSVEVFDTATRTTEWLRENPEARAEDVHRAFENPEIDGVIAAMGGNGELRVLSHLDRDLLAANPTRFYGASDNTHLHLYLNGAGLVSFYGAQLFPDLVADPTMHPYTREHVTRAFRETPLGPIESAEEWTDEYYTVGQRLLIVCVGTGSVESINRSVRRYTTSRATRPGRGSRATAGAGTTRPVTIRSPRP